MIQFFIPLRRCAAPLTFLLALLLGTAGYTQNTGHLFAEAQVRADAGAAFETVRLFDERTERGSAALAEFGIAEALLDGTVLFPDLPARSAFLNDRPQTLALSLPDPKGGEIALKLFEKSPFTENVRLQDGHFDAETFFEAVGFYRGVAEGYPDSYAAITVSEEEIRGTIHFGGHAYVLGRIKDAPGGAHILYRGEELDLPEGFSCEVYDEHVEEKPTSSTQLEAADRTLKCVRIRVEIDDDLTSSLGGEISAINYAAGLWNEVTTLFDNDGIDITVSEIFAWTGSSPYSGSIGDRLNQMSNTSPDADLTALITNVGGGGVAYLSSVCSSNFGVSVSSIFGNYNAVPTYSWDVYVCAHEVGHNLSSNHTHACAWNGNNTPIDGCGIQAGFPEGSCGTAPIPSAGGTVMSYCHLNSVGINFNQGFGTQPSTRMINYVNSRSCLGTSCASFGGVVCDDEALTLSIVLDNYPSETTWQITDENDAVLASGGPYSGFSSGTLVTEDICLPEACYTFTVFDSFGDGICCAYGNGSYLLADEDGNTLASGGEFASEESTEFCTGDAAQPVPCALPYPQIENVSIGVSSGGVLLAWDPIIGSKGCQIQGGRVGSSNLTMTEQINDDMSVFFVPGSQLPVNGGYRVRVRCGCRRNPTIVGPWSPFFEFAWNNASGTPPPAEGLFAESPIAVEAFPNPTSGEVNIHISGAKDELLTVRLFDLPGKLVRAERVQADAGDRNYRFDFSDLSEAVYLIQVAGSDGPVYSGRLVIAR